MLNLDILSETIKYLEIEDIIKIGSVNKESNKILNEYQWGELLKRDYRKKDRNNKKTSNYDKYKRKYVRTLKTSRWYTSIIDLKYDIGETGKDYLELIQKYYPEEMPKIMPELIERLIILKQNKSNNSLLYYINLQGNLHNLSQNSRRIRRHIREKLENQLYLLLNNKRYFSDRRIKTLKLVHKQNLQNLSQMTYKYILDSFPDYSPFTYYQNLQSNKLYLFLTYLLSLKPDIIKIISKLSHDDKGYYFTPNVLSSANKYIIPKHLC